MKIKHCLATEECDCGLSRFVTEPDLEMKKKNKKIKRKKKKKEKKRKSDYVENNQEDTSLEFCRHFVLHMWLIVCNLNNQ